MKDPEKEKAFLEVITQYKQQIHRVCWGFTSNPEDIKDLYQDVIINLWKGLEGFRNQSSLSTWIHRVTINTCLFWKKKKTSVNQLKETIPAVNQADFAEAGLEENLQLTDLKMAIDELKIADKTIILLVLEELSYKEIAGITGLSISNIGVRINRIKTRLKKRLNMN